MKLASLRQVTHLRDGRLDVTNEEYGTDSSTHLTWYLIASTMANKIKLTQRRVQLPRNLKRSTAALQLGAAQH